MKEVVAINSAGVIGSSIEYDDEDIIDDVEFNEDDLYNAVAPGGKYSSVTMRDWLGIAFKPIAIQTDVVFYEGSEAIIFPPVADGKPDDSLSQCISAALTQAAALLIGEQYREKKMIFPLTEVQPCFFGMGPKRMHWVTLHYDPKTETATLVDSRPTLNSYGYLIHPMKKLLTEGLGPLGLSVKAFIPIYQGIQHDDIYCGPWTATTIEALANGMTLDEHIKTISSSDRDGMIAHHRKMLLSNTNIGVYQRLDTSSHMKEASSSNSLSTAQTSLESVSNDDNDRENDEEELFLTPVTHEENDRLEVESPSLVENLIVPIYMPPVEEHQVEAVHADVLADERVRAEDIGSVDNSSYEAPRPAACPRDPEILLNAQQDRTEIDRSESCEQPAGRRDLNCQQPRVERLANSNPYHVVPVKLGIHPHIGIVVAEEMDPRLRWHHKNSTCLQDESLADERAQAHRPNYSFLITMLSHPVSKAVSMLTMLASLLFLGVVAAGMSNIPIIYGTALAAVGLFSGASTLKGNQWALQRNLVMHEQVEPQVP